jgi:hypothetical protein
VPETERRMTNIIKITAIALLPLLLAGRGAQAVEATVITLSCDGTTTLGDAKPEPFNKIGVVVNFAEHTVSFLGYVVPITSVDAANVSFEGQVKTSSFGTTLSMTVSGSVDRVTGAMTATTLTTPTMMTNLDLHCKPTNRLF